VVGVADASMGTMVQLASQGMFERSQIIATKVSSMRHSKRKKLVGEEFSLLHLVVECNALFQQVFVEKHRKKNLWIKMWSILHQAMLDSLMGSILDFGDV